MTHCASLSDWEMRVPPPSQILRAVELRLPPTFCLVWLLLLAVSAQEQVCGVCAFPIHQLFLIWGGKMNRVLVNATLFIDLGKFLAAPIHLLKDNVIRAHIILYLPLGSEYVTLLVSPFL